MKNSNLDSIFEKLKIEYDREKVPECISKSVTTTLEKLTPKRGLVPFKAIISIAALFSIMITLTLLWESQTLNPQIEITDENSYPSSLMWNGVLYNLNDDEVLDIALLGQEIGEINKVNQPMPQKNGEVNSKYPFSPKDKIYSIKDIEITEAVGILKNTKFYRINRIRTSASIIFQGNIYDFTSDFISDDQKDTLGKVIGQIKKNVSGHEDEENGEIIATGDESFASDFSEGCNIYALKDTPITVAIAVKDKNGRYQKAVYVKKDL